MHHITQLPLDDNTNGWSAIIAPRPANPKLSGAERADWVVVGGGFAGLAAAYRLASNRPNDRVILLEANKIGEGASGRNSGFAIDLPHNVGSSLAELDGSRRFMRLARSAIRHLEDQVMSHNIECDWKQSGKYHAAASERGAVDVLEPFASELKALDEPYTWLERDALSAKLGTAHFHSAVYTPGCILMNPAALTHGLMRSLPENVDVYEQSPVVSVDYRNGVTLNTPDGQVYAPQMILAVNGYAGHFGFFRRRLLPMAAHASLTRPLTDAEHIRLGGIADWGLTPANAFAGITMRYTQDRRILIRQNIHFSANMRVSDATRAKVRGQHQQLFSARFPSIADVEIAHTWTGFVCLANNGSPGFGRVASNVHAAVCQNAVGVTKGTIGGILAADMACGEDNELIADMQSLGTPDRLPPRPFLDIGVRAKFAWELFRSRHEA